VTAHRIDLGDRGHAKKLAERYPDDVEAKILYAFTVSGWRATRRTP